MNPFLKEAKIVYQNIVINPKYYDKVKVIMGNESCDLDSAISSIVYGYFLYKSISDKKIGILPLLNIPHDDLPLKTEVTFYLRENKISLDNVLTRGCKDLLDLELLHNAGKLELILVDHHNLLPSDKKLMSSVVEIIDHRPHDSNWPWNGVEHVNIRTVGSCCSLITEKALNQWPQYLTEEIGLLLIGPIVIDTRNLSPDGRATELDHAMVKELESIISIDRDQLLSDLVRERANIDSLSTQQLFRKDLKLVGDVPVPVFPVLIQDLCKRKGFEDDILTYMRMLNEAPITVMMSNKIDGDNVFRDLAIISVNSNLREKFSDSLVNSKEPALALEEIFNHSIQSMRLFCQRNIKATRKHVIPIIRNIS